MQKQFRASSTPASRTLVNDSDKKTDDKGNIVTKDLGKPEDYFPVEFVVPAIIKVYENLLGVRFELMSDVSVWHEGQLAGSALC